MATNTLLFTGATHRGSALSKFVCTHTSGSVIEARFVVGAFSTRAAANAFVAGSRTDEVEHYGTCAVGSSINTLYAHGSGPYNHIARVDIILVESSNSNQIILTDEEANIGKPVYDPVGDTNGYLDCLRSMVTLQFPIVSDSSVMNTRKFNLEVSA